MHRLRLVHGKMPEQKSCPTASTKDVGNDHGHQHSVPAGHSQKGQHQPAISAASSLKGKCGVCAKVCPTGAINYAQEGRTHHRQGRRASSRPPGYDLMDWTVYQEYGGGRYPDVITSLQYERLLSASGPTGGHVKRPSDGKEPKSVVFIQCVGSRDPSVGRPTAPGFCCMYTAKQAILTKDHIPDSQSPMSSTWTSARREKAMTSSPAGPWKNTGQVHPGPRFDDLPQTHRHG
jgi:heterodisulfide reductase subunit A